MNSVYPQDNTFDFRKLAMIESTIKEMFETSCKLIINENLDEAEFELYKNIIQTTLTYLTIKRKNNENKNYGV